MTGERPTHPLLLDWLASRLIESEWSLKTLQREILLSSTYQLDTQYNEHNTRVDGDNRWLWRTNRRRLGLPDQAFSRHVPHVHPERVTLLHDRR